MLIGLYARSALAAAAFDGARLVATRGVEGLDAMEAARPEAEGRVRQLLGTAGLQATFDWSGTDPAFVVLRVSIPAPSIGWPGFHHTPGRLDRTVRVRVEALR